MLSTLFPLICLGRKCTQRMTLFISNIATQSFINIKRKTLLLSCLYSLCFSWAHSKNTIKRRNHHVVTSINSSSRWMGGQSLSHPASPPSGWTSAFSGPSGPWRGTVFSVPPCASWPSPPLASPSPAGTPCVWRAAPCALSLSCSGGLQLEHGAKLPPNKGEMNTTTRWTQQIKICNTQTCHWSQWVPRSGLAYLLLMGFSDDRGSLEIPGGFSFSSLPFQFAFEGQGFLELFGNMKFVELSRGSDHRLEKREDGF